MFTPCMSPEQPTTMTNLVTTGNVTLTKFFMSPSDVAVYAQGSAACCGSLLKLAGLLSKIHEASDFTAGVWSFPYHGWSESRIYLCNQTAIKPQDPETQMGFPGQRHFYTCCVWPQWKRTHKSTPNLSGLCLMFIFLLLFLLFTLCNNKPQPVFFSFFALYPLLQ